MDSVKLDGKTVIVTGSSSGIGIPTARVLAEKGARVIMANRSEEKTEPIRQDIIQSTGNQNVVFMKLDLSSFESIRAFADAFNKNEDRLDILINNAAMLTGKYKKTEDGFELLFGTNYLGPFLLTNLLLNKIKKSAPSRIVNVSSLGHEKNPIKFDDLNAEKKFDYLSAYGASKSGNIMMSVQLAKILEGTGVTVYSLHPGVIPSGLVREFLSGDPASCCFKCLFGCLTCLRFCQPNQTPEQGAQTTLYCALDPSLAEVSGRYYSDVKEKSAKPHATDPERCEKLWQISVEMCNL